MAFEIRLRKTVLAVALALPGTLLPMHAAQAQIAIGVSINIAPPALPVYEQPPLPAPGYLWTPGYWAYGDAGYFWVPGVWVQPPTVGVLWTPGYWGFESGSYGWHEGYWGPHVGFYGGVNYGFGFGGIGFVGGEWRGGEFAYNSAAANVGSVHVTNVYNNTTIIRQNTIVNNTHTSFNGPGGVTAQPTAQEQQFAHEQHTPPTGNQVETQKAASQDRAQLASINHGTPGTPAVAKDEVYRQTAAEHAKTQPITAADRAPAAAAAKPGAATPQPRPAEAAAARPAAPAAGQIARPPSGKGALDKEAHTEAPAEHAETPTAPREAAAPRPAPARPTPVARPAPAAAPVEKDVQRPANAGAAPAQPKPAAPRAEAPRPEAARPEAAHPEAPRPAPKEEKEKEKP